MSPWRQNIVSSCDTRFGTQPSFYENAASGSESTLIPTTEEIQKICPRSALQPDLSGVGKTSLINEAFGVRGQVSDDGAGKADIDYEHLSEGNDLFAVHDSQGFEQGEVTKLKTVQDFIERRSKEPELKNQLHVIWLCLEAPAMGNRLLEGGTIEFLSQRSKGSIHVPIVVIFTKFDKLVNEYKIDLMRRKDSDAENHALQKANESIEEYCAKSLRDVAGEDIRYLAVSNKKKYSHRIRQLVELTSEDVYKHVASEPSIMAAMAQRTSIDLKIKQSIEYWTVMKGYWKALLMGTGFGNTKINDILRVVHIDIVNVWNLENPKNPVESRKTHVNNLIDPRFYNLMFAMVSELGPTTGNDTTSDSLGVLDVAVGLVGVQWAYGVYQRTHELQRKFMAYIIDLTYIIYILFVLTLGENGPYRKQPAITRRLIKGTYSKYYDSPLKVHVHSKIREYDDNKGPIARVRRDNAFELIEKLLDELLEAGKSSGTQAIDVGEASPQDDDEPW
ncbi:hypothetical protein F5887DRAFT_998336 [Amanita rubescens]|nr:hypothetical protein F5887DRAFT_1004444 [Amanita rubescens]KAF8331528.1 hypothetical protein F5887DRAFT_998336 [Amanita rubescens]